MGTKRQTRTTSLATILCWMGIVWLAVLVVIASNADTNDDEN
jgi:hypothetical protein